MKKSAVPAVKRRKRSMPQKVTRRRKTGVRRSRGLGDMLNPTIATNSAKAIFSAGTGGAAAIFADRLIPTTWGTGARLLAGAVASFVLHSVVQAPNMASGFFGGMVAMNMKTALYDNDDTRYVDRNTLKDAPLFLDEDGNVLAMDDDGNYHQLDEDEIAELAEDVDFIEV